MQRGINKTLQRINVERERESEKRRLTELKPSSIRRRINAPAPSRAHNGVNKVNKAQTPTLPPNSALPP